MQNSWRKMNDISCTFVCDDTGYNKQHGYSIVGATIHPSCTVTAKYETNCYSGYEILAKALVYPYS